VKDLFKYIISGSNSTPPENVQIAFNSMFNGATAIFVYHGKEIICRFDKSSVWVETRTNQDLEEIDAKITDTLKNLGEIMSSILIEKPGSVLFEFVIRDKDMNRQIYFTDPTGEIVEKRGFNSVYDLF
jgi:hypothetical protein